MFTPTCPHSLGAVEFIRRRIFHASCCMKRILLRYPAKALEPANISEFLTRPHRRSWIAGSSGCASLWDHSENRTLTTEGTEGHRGKDTQEKTHRKRHTEESTEVSPRCLPLCSSVSSVVIIIF